MQVLAASGGQTYAVASNLQSVAGPRHSLPVQMQMRPIAPNAATVVNHIQVNYLFEEVVKDETDPTDHYQSILQLIIMRQTQTAKKSLSGPGDTRKVLSVSC